VVLDAGLLSQAEWQSITMPKELTRPGIAGGRRLAGRLKADQKKGDEQNE
jgi:aspartate ammonia-lyase